MGQKHVFRGKLDWILMSGFALKGSFVCIRSPGLFGHRKSDPQLMQRGITLLTRVKFTPAHLIHYLGELGFGIQVPVKDTDATQEGNDVSCETHGSDGRLWARSAPGKLRSLTSGGVERGVGRKKNQKWKEINFWSLSAFFYINCTLHLYVYGTGYKIPASAAGRAEDKYIWMNKQGE